MDKRFMAVPFLPMAVVLLATQHNFSAIKQVRALQFSELPTEQLQAKFACSTVHRLVPTHCHPKLQPHAAAPRILFHSNLTDLLCQRITLADAMMGGSAPASSEGLQKSETVNVHSDCHIASSEHDDGLGQAPVV